jgi:class 3 adenylate cyclase
MLTMSREENSGEREVIRTYQACVATPIHQFDGFIARYVGDGVLIYFGWPEARETDAERAVRAGLAVAAAVSNGPIGGATGPHWHRDGTGGYRRGHRLRRLASADSGG